MKVLIAVVLALGSVSALGSGPYLPSGWRPEGPAFYLPSEQRLPATNPLKDVLLQGSEASGSDFLREYGPPKLQELPKEVTEQTFAVLEAKFSDDEGVRVEAATEVITELRSALVEEPVSVTESQTESVEEVTALAEETPIQGKSLNLEVETVAEDIEATTQEVEGSEKTVEEQVNAKIQEEEYVEERVRNIAEAIDNLEKKVVAEEVQISQDIAEFKSVEQTSGVSAQVPEGFLEYGPPGFQEYGPPGFKEYGPPKEDALLRSEDASSGTEEAKIESNETRRRRFSPKFRSTKKY